MNVSNWIALISAVLSFLSVIFMALTFWIQRNHNIKSLMPCIMPIIKATKIKNEEFSIAVGNCGIGPAIIYNVFVSCAGKKLNLDIFNRNNTLKFINQVIETNVKLNSDSFHCFAACNVDGCWLKPNDEIKLFWINSDDVNTSDINKFAQLLSMIEFQIVYGSLYDTKAPKHKLSNQDLSLKDFAEYVTKKL